MVFTSINPATGKPIKAYEAYTPGDVEAKIEKAYMALQGWRKLEFKDRAVMMRKASDILKTKSRKYGEVMTAEMGKPVLSGVSEAEKCSWVCAYYADNAEKFLKEEVIKTDATRSYITFQPLGVLLAVMPWNFPFWQVFRFAASVIMAGNVVLLKHASNVPGCALAIKKVFEEAGFPPEIFQTLLIGTDQVGKILENPLVQGVTLTGSVPAGKAVAQKAGSFLKKTVLELGGSDPYLILKDADLEKTVQTCAASRLINSGQSCIAAKRFIVVKEIQTEFEERFISEMKNKKMGDPMDEDTVVGPQARHDLRDELHRQVEESIKKGANLALGGKIPDDKGAYYPPTVLTNVSKGMPAFDEELFGPVAAIITAENEEEAIQLANDSNFGLGAAVFTRDVQAGERIAASEIDAGNVFINSFVKSDPRLPFGGIKESGYGRELSHYGIKEFVNVKTIYVD